MTHTRYILTYNGMKSAPSTKATVVGMVSELVTIAQKHNKAIGRNSKKLAFTIDVEEFIS
jgi:hypothetical protein